MIYIQKTPDKISIIGHARARPAGQDLVCCAVSTLFQSLLFSLEQLTEDKIEYEINPGNSWIRYGNLSEAGRLLTDSFFIGAKAIADTSPEYVRAWMT